MITTLVILLIATAVLSVLLFAQYRRTDKLEEQLRDKTQGIFFTVNTFQEIEHDVYEVFNRTPATRFLILTAVNGHKPYRHVSAIYEQVHGDKALVSVGATGRYVDLEVDDHYQNMLKNIEQIKYQVFFTNTMPDSILKDIYINEQVVSSYVFLLGRYKIDENNDRILYCSIATHENSGFEAHHQAEFLALSHKVASKINKLQEARK